MSYYTSIHSFFSYPSGTPPDLHSFPTRRSSDLQAPGVADVRYDREWLQRLASVVGVIRGAGLVLANHANHGRTRQDRKSTRLNSSHRCISYAVFCLKKKKKKKLVLVHKAHMIQS